MADSNSVTILDVAKMANVSPSTVTHSLNGKRPVSEKTKKRIQDAIDALGYVPPSWNASRLKGRRSGMIGCLSTDITETFVNQIVRGIEKSLNGGVETMLFVSAVEFGNNYNKAFDFLFNHNVDGIVLCHHIPFDARSNFTIPECDVPVVAINMEVPGVVSVMPNNMQGGYIAADHLFSSGMRHPAIICGPANRMSVNMRLKGYLQRLKELQLEEPREYYFGEYDFQHGYDAMMQILEKNKRVDGVFAENDYLAAGAINALHDKGLSVPKDIKVIGFDNRDFSEFWRPPITTFQQPLQEMGMLGMSVLHSMIAHGNAPDKLYVLEPRLITRFSTTGVAP
ncbi:MAG: LacI family transcriptional regulator [Sphaerochaeta sp.]|jgi:LacI family transcriptional regulator|nr:MAG: LacI family transcriptional regulator [Sphaerochaeta sp.]